MTIKLWYVTLNLIIILAGSFLFGYWYFIDGTYLHVPLTMRTDTTNIATDKSAYHVGDTVYIHTSFCKNYSYTSVTNWNLVNGLLRPFPSKTYQVPLGCADTWFPIVKIPSDITRSDESYHLEGATEIRVNPFKVINYYFTTQQFHIL